MSPASSQTFQSFLQLVLMNVCAGVTLMDVIEHGQLTSIGCFLVSESNNCFTAIPTKTPCRFIYRTVQVYMKGWVIHVVDKTLVNKVILGTWIISLHSMQFAQQIAVQLEEMFDAFPMFASHAFSNGTVVVRIISIPMCKDGTCFPIQCPMSNGNTSPMYQFRDCQIAPLMAHPRATS